LAVINGSPLVQNFQNLHVDRIARGVELLSIWIKFFLREYIDQDVLRRDNDVMLALVEFVFPIHQVMVV
jgi:hypothetical protein